MKILTPLSILGVLALSHCAVDNGQKEIETAVAKLASVESKKLEKEEVKIRTHDFNLAIFIDHLLNDYLYASNNESQAQVIYVNGEIIKAWHDRAHSAVVITSEKQISLDCSFSSISVGEQGVVISATPKPEDIPIAKFDPNDANSMGFWHIQAEHYIGIVLSVLRDDRIKNGGLLLGGSSSGKP